MCVICILFTLKLNRNRKTKPLLLRPVKKNVIPRFNTNTIVQYSAPHTVITTIFLCCLSVVVSFTLAHSNLHHADVLVNGCLVLVCLHYMDEYDTRNLIVTVQRRSMWRLFVCAYVPNDFLVKY